MDTRHWQRLKSGPGPDVVVAVDFQPVGSEPGFRDLAPLMDVAFPIWQPVPPARPTGAGPDAYPDRWLDNLAAEGVKVRAVLGNCAGAALAGTLAGGLARRSVRPVVVMFDPHVVRGTTLLHQFRLAVAQFRDLATRADVTAAEQRVERACRDADAPTVAAVCVAEYRAIAVSVFADLGLDADVGGQLCDRFALYVEYLIACWRADYADVDEPAVTILSESWSQPAGLRGKSRRFPVSRMDLYTDTDVAAAASAVVRAAV